MWSNPFFKRWSPRTQTGRLCFVCFRQDKKIAHMYHMCSVVLLSPGGPVLVSFAPPPPFLPIPFHLFFFSSTGTTFSGRATKPRQPHAHAKQIQPPSASPTRPSTWYRPCSPWSPRTGKQGRFSAHPSSPVAVLTPPPPLLQTFGLVLTATPPPPCCRPLGLVLTQNADDEINKLGLAK